MSFKMVDTTQTSELRADENSDNGPIGNEDGADENDLVGRMKHYGSDTQSMDVLSLSESEVFMRNSLSEYTQHMI